MVEGDNINDLRIAINNALDRDFPTTDIYAEEIKQGFEEPCFFVKILSSNQDKQMRRTYKRTIDFDIHYFSDKEDDINSDCLEMANSLYSTLEYIEIYNQKYRALKMKHEVVDGVLHFMLQFNYNILEIIKCAKMKTLEVEMHGK